MTLRDSRFCPSDCNSTVLHWGLWWNILFLKQIPVSQEGKFTSERAPSPKKSLFWKQNQNKRNPTTHATSPKSPPDKPILLKIIIKKSPLLAKDLSQQDSGTNMGHCSFVELHMVFCRQNKLTSAKLILTVLSVLKCMMTRTLKLQHLG